MLARPVSLEAAPCPRGNARDGREHACEVTLVSKSTNRRYVCERHGSRPQQLLRTIDAILEKPPVRGNAGRAPERARKVAN